jgi:hypothetical protein
LNSKNDTGAGRHFPDSQLMLVQPCENRHDDLVIGDFPRHAKGTRPLQNLTVSEVVASANAGDKALAEIFYGSGVTPADVVESGSGSGSPLGHRGRSRDQ